MWKILSRATIALMCAASFVTAQDESRGLSVRMLLLAPGGATMELHTLTAETKKLTGPILVGARGLSTTADPGALSFSLAIPDKSKESGFRSVADVALPPGGREFIILLEPAGKTFKTHIVSGKQPRFRNDSTMFFNATDSPVGLTLGNEKIVIPSRKPTLAEAPAKGERPWYQVTFYESQNGEKPRIFANTRWPHRISSRCYVFLYRSEPSGQINYQAVDESISPET